MTNNYAYEKEVVGGKANDRSIILSLIEVYVLMCMPVFMLAQCSAFFFCRILALQDLFHFIQKVTER